MRATGAAPALLVGADFGALAVLDVLLRYGDLVHAAVLVDPPAYMFVPEATEALSEQRDELEAELREGGPEALERERGRVVDFGAIASLPLGRGILREVDVPVRIVLSPRAREHDRAAAAALLEALPTAEPADDVVSAVTELAT